MQFIKKYFKQPRFRHFVQEKIDFVGLDIYMELIYEKGLPSKMEWGNQVINLLFVF